jgi:hypothetical protein
MGYRDQPLLPNQLEMVLEVKYFLVINLDAIGIEVFVLEIES